MDFVALHDRALQSTTSIVANVDREQFDDPTPCAEFDVRTLLNHMVAGNLRFVAFAHGESGEATPALGDYIDGGALAAYRESADAVSKAFSDPAVLERTVSLPIGDVTGAAALGIHLVETVVHGWDLARATGQPTEIDPELCAAAWECTRGVDDSLRGPGLPFGPAVTPPPGASPTDTLVAWLGRQP